LAEKLTEIRNILNDGVFNCIEEVKINKEIKSKFHSLNKYLPELKAKND